MSLQVEEVSSALKSDLLDAHQKYKLLSDAATRGQVSERSSAIRPTHQQHYSWLASQDV